MKLQTISETIYVYIVPRGFVYVYDLMLFPS